MKFVSAVIVLSLTSWVKAQNHYEYWSKFQIEHQTGKHWVLGSDIQFRSQSNYRIQSVNPFQYPLAYSFRIWTNYKTPEITFILSPFAFFRNIEIGPDTVTLNNDEWRAAAGIQKNSNIFHAESSFRFMLEHRQFINPGKQFNRARFQLRIRPMVIGHGRSSWQPYIQEEYFLRLDPGKYLCDQNRVQIGFRYKTSKVDLSIAYQNTRQRSNIWINRHQIFTSLLYTL